MTKREELGVRFYMKLDECNSPYFIFDLELANDQYRQLQFINFLPANIIPELINFIDTIQSGQHYDSEFLTISEEFFVFDVIFTCPYFYVGGYQAIHMNDLKFSYKSGLNSEFLPLRVFFTRNDYWTNSKMPKPLLFVGVLHYRCWEEELKGWWFK